MQAPTSHQISHAREFNNITRTMRGMFPNAADYSGGRYCSRLRPTTLDGPPIIGDGRDSNLFYNTGHGHIGWTMAPVTGKLGADLIAGRASDLPMADMGVRS